MMSFLCCRVNKSRSQHGADPHASVATESRSHHHHHHLHHSHLSRHKTGPKPRASQSDIEKLYREGRELRRAEQEEEERAILHTALRKEYTGGRGRDWGQDDDPLIDLSDPPSPTATSPSPLVVRKAADERGHVTDAEATAYSSEVDEYLETLTAGSSRYVLETNQASWHD